nr:hypothetical protein [Tanacetum cinerariifolium]
RTFTKSPIAMQNAITTLRIQNFKSIKDVTMQPRRVNIIIGEPNVGKSNILEALSLLGGMVYEQEERFMGNFIRPSTSALSVRLYLFRKYNDYKRSIGGKFLEPPFGKNILDIIRGSTNLSEEIAALLKQTGHRMLVRVAEKSLEVMQEINNISYTYPYSSIADTLQRLIFYLAAIESNDDAVLLFEEPEAHSYPRQWQLFGSSRSVVGIIDRDKRLGSIAYLDEFTELVGGSLASEAPHSIRSHPACPNQHLIVLNPACDTWVWQAAVAAGIVLPAHDLPADRWAFIEYCKVAGIENQTELK